MGENTASKRLAKGTIVYMIGNMTSKVLQMLILPIVTSSLVTSEYGYYDLIVTTISLMTPIVTFQMIEGMFRFMFHASEEEKKRTVSTVTAFLLSGFLVLGCVMLLVSFVFPQIRYPGLIYLNYISAILYNYFQKLARCQGKNRQFAVSGVVNTIVMLAFQALTLIVFKLGIDGMLIANAVSYFAASIYLSYYVQVRKWIKIKNIRFKVFKELFVYSAPLIPNSIGWWLIAPSDKYVIALLLDNAANGIYSIAGKFSQLLTFITSVFQLAWQESAIIESNSKERDRFYSQTFNSYMKFLMGGYLVALPFIKLLIPILLEESYQVGYLYNPILLAGAIFAAFSQFYGSAYLVFKKTGGAFSTTVVAAIVNIVIGMGMIKWIGLFAPALGTASAFAIQWLLRARQMREYFKVKIEKKSFFTLIFCMLLTTGCYYINNQIVQVVFVCLGAVAFFVFNRSYIEKMLRKIKRA